MFWLFFNSERLSSHPTKSIQQYKGEGGNGDFANTLCYYHRMLGFFSNLWNMNRYY